ncbi:unnamed protein product [Caenorhabditis nigoni]|uniref:Uncharacterized protein n=1 Tax=Caenorhabditis nigoni TaxID=1611254 RepID=A0A2G5UIH2_9PELO|nr:hypothetical protein B9Z55_011067 [Caenorhabditis nigoni]
MCTLLKAPHDTVAKIGEKKFYGRHDEMIVEPVKLFGETIPGLTHAQADEMDRRNMEIGADIDEVNKKILRDSIGFGSSIEDALKYLEITLADNCEVSLLRNSLFFYF